MTENKRSAEPHNALNDLPPSEDLTVRPFKRNTSRRNAPSFTPLRREVVIKNILSGIAKKHDIKEDLNIQQARLSGAETILYFLKGTGAPKYQTTAPRCAIMRQERAETMEALKLACIQHADFSLDTQLLFEVKWPMEKIAEFVGQHHQYENGRVAIDCVRNGFRDFEIADEVIIVRELCNKTGKNKASRIFLTPKFFNSFGVSDEYLCKLMRQLRAARKISGTLNDLVAKCRAQFARRATSAKIAGLWRSDLNAKLKRIKDKFKQIEEQLNSKGKQKAADKAQKQAEKARLKQEKKDAETLSKTSKTAKNAAVASVEVRDKHLADISAMFEDLKPKPT